MKNKNILVLEKRGCDFWNDEPLKKISDFGNYRLFFRFTTNNNKNIYGDVQRGYVWENGKRKRDDSINFDLQYENEKGCWRFTEIYSFYDEKTEFFNSKSLLKIINKISKTQFDDVLIFDNIYNKIKKNAGYREKNILQTLEKVNIIQNDEKYFVLRFSNGFNNFFDYEVNSDRVVG